MKMNDVDSKIFELAQSSAHCGNIEEAISLLIELTDKYPKNGLIHAVLGLRYKQAGLMENSELAYQKAVTAYPKNEHCSLGLFHCLWGQDKKVDALNEMKRFLNIAKSNEYDELLKCDEIKKIIEDTAYGG